MKLKIQNFIKNIILYAQDSTRKTIIKKKYICAMDYTFNETKFETIEFSLELLDKKLDKNLKDYMNVI